MPAKLEKLSDNLSCSKRQMTGIAMVAPAAQSHDRTVKLRDVAKLFGGPKLLGHRVNNALDAHDMLLEGLPERALSHFVDRLVVIEWDQFKKVVGMSRRTYQRRKGTPEKPLRQEQSERTWKFAEILAKASLLLGFQEDGEHWLESPAMGLNGERPIDLLATRAGAEIVENFLDQLEYGVYV